MKLGSDSAPDLIIAPADVTVRQFAGRLVLPSGARILELGSYVLSQAGYGSLDYRLCLWRWNGAVGDANALLGQTAIHTVMPAADVPSNLVRVTWPLVSPVELGTGAEVMVGVAWDTDPAKVGIFGGYSGTGLRYRKEVTPGSAWPVSMKACDAFTDHDFAAWIESYAPLSGVFVLRGGEWVQAESVLVRRDGSWASPGGPINVKVRRSGVWVDAS